MKKRGQHYVWKNYLKSWTTNGKLFCLRDNKIFDTNPYNIAQQRDFYRLKELTEKEIRFIKGLIDRLPSEVKSLHTGQLDLFNSIFTIKECYESLDIKCAEVEKQLDIRINNFEEDLHSSIEGIGAPYINKILESDLSFWDNESSRGEFSYYLAIQYFRTKRMRNRVLASSNQFNSNAPTEFSDYLFDMERAFGVLSHILAVNVGDNLACMQLELLRNDTNLPFITTDQPAINLIDDGNGIDIPPTGFELYYPVSPNTAIIIFNNRIPIFSNDICEDDVTELNDMMEKASLEQIYANKQTVLERYQKSNMETR